MRKADKLKNLIKANLLAENRYLLKENSTPEYDSILDIYNTRKEKMTSSENDFLKSGGKTGGNFIFNLPDEIVSTAEKTMHYLDSNNINWSIGESWAPSFGMLRFLIIDKNVEVLNHLEKLWGNIKNGSHIPFVTQGDENGAIKEQSDKILVWLIDPSDYSDIGPVTKKNKNNHKKT